MSAGIFSVDFGDKGFVVVVFNGEAFVFGRGDGDAVVGQLIFSNFNGVAVFVGEFDFDAVVIRFVAFGVGHLGRVFNDFDACNVGLVEGGTGCTCFKVGLFRNGLVPRIIHVPLRIFEVVCCFRCREFVLGQFAVFKDGVGFAVQGVVFHAGFITGYADFEDAVG